MKTNLSKKHENGHHPNSRPKNTSKHPWRRKNSDLPTYSKLTRIKQEQIKDLTNLDTAPPMP